jgi:hypothetical protein
MMGGGGYGQQGYGQGGYGGGYGGGGQSPFSLLDFSSIFPLMSSSD